MCRPSGQALVQVCDVSAAALRRPARQKSVSSAALTAITTCEVALSAGLQLMVAAPAAEVAATLPTNSGTSTRCQNLNGVLLVGRRPITVVNLRGHAVIHQARGGVFDRPTPGCGCPRTRRRTGAAVYAPLTNLSNPTHCRPPNLPLDHVLQPVAGVSQPGRSRPWSSTGASPSSSAESIGGLPFQFHGVRAGGLDHQAGGLQGLRRLLPTQFP